VSLAGPNSSTMLKTTFNTTLPATCGASKCVLTYQFDDPLPTKTKVSVVPQSGWLAQPKWISSATLSPEGTTLKIVIVPDQPVQGTGTALVTELAGANGIDDNSTLRVGGGLATMVIIDPAKTQSTEMTASTLQIGPNPASESLKINYLGDAPAQARIISATGQQMARLDLSAGQPTSLDVQQFPNGLYYLQTGQQSTPIVIQH